MGEARRRGTRPERIAAAMKKESKKLAKELFELDSDERTYIKAGIKPFLDLMGPDEWRKRRQAILDHLNTQPEDPKLAGRSSVRFSEDEIGWYIFLAEQTLENPLCNDAGQAARNLPFIASLGARWRHHVRIEGLEKKISELLGKHKSDPDGLLFELLVAFSYAEMGWDVELLEERPPRKSPDLLVKKGSRKLFVECKRQSRRSEYTEKEKEQYLKQWDIAKHKLRKNGQWLWLKCEYHQEIFNLDENFLQNVFEKKLPIGKGESKIYEGPEATIYARQIEMGRVKEHISKNYVKFYSPFLNQLLGQDWAPKNASVSLISEAKPIEAIGCEAPILGSYIEDLAWACGMTRKFSAEESIEKKARDVKKLLSKAVTQLPDDDRSVVHIAVEALEGEDVENRRTEKIMQSIPNFIVDKPVESVWIHKLQPNFTTDKLWEIDESTAWFTRQGASTKDIPQLIVATAAAEPIDKPF